MKVTKETSGKNLVIPVSISPFRRTRAQCRKRKDHIAETNTIELNKKSKKKAKVKLDHFDRNNYSLTQSTKRNSQNTSNSVKSDNSLNYSVGLNVVLDIPSPARDQIMNNNFIKSNLISPIEKTTNYFIKFEKMMTENKFSLNKNDLYELKYLLQIKKFIIKESNPLLKHKNIKQSYRQRLIMWISELCCEFKFERFTFFMTLNLIDLFMSKTVDWQFKKLQLLGIAALMLSSKFNEVDSNRISIYTEKSDNSYSIIEIKTMEIHLIKVKI